MEIFNFHVKQEENIYLAAQLFKLDKFICTISTVQWILHLLLKNSQILLKFLKTLSHPAL